MRTTYANCTIHGRQPARQLPATDYRMGYALETMRTWRRGDLVKCGHQNDEPRFDCNSPSTASTINATTTESECGDRCMAARGDDCECSCGGQNHGIAA